MPPSQLPSAPGAGPARVAPGAVVGGYEVTGIRAVDEARVRGEGGTELALALGASPSLSLEAAALTELGATSGDGAEAVGRRSPFPAFVAFGDDARHGAYLVTAAPAEDVVALGVAAAAFDVARARAVVGRVLDLAERIERAGFSWRPLAGDVGIVGGPERGPDPAPGREGAIGDDDARDGETDGAADVVLTRVRVVARLARGARLDARRVLEGIGTTFLARAAELGVPAFARFFAARRGKRTAWTIDRARDELARTALVAVAAGPGDAAGAPPVVAAAATTADASVDDRSADLGAVSDVGLRDRNDDAFALARAATPHGVVRVVVVADGVASSSGGDRAARLAVRVTCDALVAAVTAAAAPRAADPAALPDDEAAVRAAIARAHDAVCAAEAERERDAVVPAGTTLVVAVVRAARIVVGWVGDSRAYFVHGAVADLLTRDHSWARHAVLRGELDERAAARAPHAHVLTRCLGPMGERTGGRACEPDVTTFAPTGPGALVLCTDGVWGAFAGAAEIAAAAHAGPAAAPNARAADAARALLCTAIAAGANDNVTAAVCVVDAI